MTKNFNAGWVAIGRRDIMEMPGYFDEPFDRAHCLLDLTLLAEWKPTRSFYLRGHLVTVHRGQIAISLRDLSKRWNLAEKTVRRRINDFEKLGYLTTERSHLITIITLCHYDDYVRSEEKEDASGDTQTDTQIPTQTTAPDTAPGTAAGAALSLTNKKNKKKVNNPKNAYAQEEDGGGGDACVVSFDSFFADINNRTGAK